MNKDYVQKLAEIADNSKLTTEFKFANFSRFTQRRTIANFINRYEIYKHVQNINGSIVECGVNLGQGLFSWTHFVNIMEPYNHSRRIIGFDTFEGFQALHDYDAPSNYETDERWKKFAERQSIDEIEAAIEAHEMAKVLDFAPRTEVVKGDATKTIPEYVQKNNYLLVALLHLDFDIYKPTLAAIEHLVPRMPKGAVIAFDELNDPNDPGETLAYLESGLAGRGYLRRNSFDSNLCYMILD